MAQDDARTTATPAGRDGASHPSARELAGAQRAKDEPTLADAETDRRAIVAAKRLMDDWGVARWAMIGDALAIAHDRVRGARRRAGYERPD